MGDKRTYTMSPAARAQRQVAGWGRARQLAAHRRHKPTQEENLVREVVAGLGLAAWYEVEITHPDGQPQWLDIVAWLVGVGPVVIEVNGNPFDHTRPEIIDLDQRKRAYLNQRATPHLTIGHQLLADGPEAVLAEVDAWLAHVFQGWGVGITRCKLCGWGLDPDGPLGVVIKAPYAYHMDCVMAYSGEGS